MSLFRSNNHPSRHHHASADDDHRTAQASKPLLFALIAVLMFGLISCSSSPDKAQKPDAAADEPQRMALSLVEDLRFGGSDSDDRLIWGSPATAVNVDSKGQIYITDLQENRVLVFSESGEFVKQVGRKGKGPGEFEGLAQFHVYADGSAVALEMVNGSHPKLQFFDKDLQHVRTSERSGPPFIIQYAAFPPSGSQFTAQFIHPSFETKQFLYTTAILDDSFNIVHEIETVAAPLPDRSRFGQPGYWSERIADNLKRFYNGITVFNYDDKGFLYVANTSRYEVSRYDQQGQKTPFLKHTFKPIMYTDTEREAILDAYADQFRADPELAEIVNRTVLAKAIELADPPPVKGPIFGLIPLEDEKLLVVRDLNLDNRFNAADLVASNGDFISNFEIPDNGLVNFFAGGYIPRMIFRNGFAYTILSDQLGENQLVRYRVEWVPVPANPN